MNSKTLFIASALSVICLPTIAAPATAQSSDFFEILENDQSVNFFTVPEGAVLSTELRNDGFTTSLSAAADVIDDRTYKILHRMIVEALPLSEQPVFWTGERVEGRFGFTFLSDEITIFSDTPGITPGITGGTVSFFFDVTGTVSNSLNLLPDRSSSAYRVNELSSTLSLGLAYSNTSFGIRSEDIVDEEISLPSPLTFPDRELYARR
jgi:hypothetical protein